jgi:S-adenosylmethionine synthetase
MGRDSKKVNKSMIFENNNKKEICVELFTWEKLDYVDLLSKKFKNFYKNEK